MYCRKGYYWNTFCQDQLWKVKWKFGIWRGSGSTEYVDLTDFRRTHILNNHKYGAGKPDKTEFPQSWSDDKILHYVSDVATNPNATGGVGKRNSPYAIGVREGIAIRVDFYPDAHKNYSDMISTAYPLNTLPNPPKGGEY